MRCLLKAKDRDIGMGSAGTREKPGSSAQSCQASHNMKMDLLFRKATVVDTSIIARIGAETFKGAFGAENTPGDMEEYLNANFNPKTISSQIEDEFSTFLLGYEGDSIFGYAMLHEGTPPDSLSGSNPIELVRFYVIGDVIGLGYGSELMRACLDEATRMGFSTIWLGVWEKNARAIHFYEKWGFTNVGEKQFVLGSDVQTDLIMLRSIIEHA
jgi:ribosomal protein S18 acetylase RimI-like enzyme